MTYIDGFRGLAILLVLLFHTWEAARSPAAYWWNPLYSGQAGVTLFLLLSGFCLYWPLVKPRAPAPEPSLAAFARRRAHRLLPPYFITLALVTAAACLYHARGRAWPLGPAGGVGAILTAAGWHALMLHALRPEQIFTLDGPMWSLALEVSLYVAMPLLVVVARRWGIGWAVGLAAAVTLTYRLGVDRLVGGAAGWIAQDPATDFVLADFLPGQWLTFALGMAAAALVARSRPAEGRPAGGRVPVLLLAWVSLAAAAFLSQRLTRYNPFSDALFGLGFFFLVLQASRPVEALRGPIPRWVNAAFRWPALVWLGEISYSVYLVHYPLLKIAEAAFPLPAGHDRLAFGANALFLVPILALSYVFHLCCERPFMNPRRRP